MRSWRRTSSSSGDEVSAKVGRVAGQVVRAKKVMARRAACAYQYSFEQKTRQ